MQDLQKVSTVDGASAPTCARSDVPARDMDASEISFRGPSAASPDAAMHAAVVDLFCAAFSEPPYYERWERADADAATWASYATRCLSMAVRCRASDVGERPAAAATPSASLSKEADATPRSRPTDPKTDDPLRSAREHGETDKEGEELLGFVCACPLLDNAEENAGIIACIKERQSEGALSFAPDRAMYIGELVVAAAYRRRGLARRLVRDALLWGAASGLEYFVVTTDPANRAAIALYERIGTRCGFEQRVGTPRGESTHYIFFCGPIRPAIELL